MKFNYFLGITVCSWLLLLMVIVSELYSPFKDLLKAIFGHHWIGKVVITIIVFLLVGFLFAGKKTNEKTAYYSAIASLALILLFFIINFLKG